MSTRIVFMGTPEFATTILTRLLHENYSVVAVVCQPDKPTGRHMIMTPPPVKQLAESFGLPILQPQKIRTPEFLAEIQALSPDLIVTAAYGRILPQSVLDVPKFGCLNVHASILPSYRGAAPIQWSILNGDDETGVTVMRMDAGMDTGDILAISRIPVGPDVTTLELTQSLAAVGADLIAGTIPGYLSGEIKPSLQDHSRASFSPPITKEQGLIDWNATATAIHNRIRAFSSWPGAYSYLEGTRIKIYASKVDAQGDQRRAEYRAVYGEPRPGTIVYATKTELSVACGDGCVSLLCVQPDSSKKLLVTLCAHNYRAGQIFEGTGV